MLKQFANSVLPSFSYHKRSCLEHTITCLRPITSLVNINQHHPCGNGSRRSIHTSQTLCSKTVKRRKRYPFFWLQDQYRAFYDENLTSQNEEFFQKFLKDKYSGKSPLRAEPWDLSQKFQDGLARTGLIGIKLGLVPLWTKEGKRVLTTVVMISDNHVVKYHPPEEYSRIGRPVDRKRYSGLGCIVVGADSKDPRMFTSEYNGLFVEGAVMPKRKLTRFFINHESRLEPGTPLVASHFRPGMFVDVYGKSRELGLQGVRRRFQLKLGPKTHGVTKAHNRIGSIGRGRKECGPKKGRRMQGYHGGERCIQPGLKIYKVNTKYNLLYIQAASIPGKDGDYVNIMDSRMPNKTLSEDNPPPFPTATLEENDSLPAELNDTELHLPFQPSIIFEITEEDIKRRKALLRDGPRFAKTAQKIR